MRWGSLSTGSEGRLPLRPTPIFRPPNDDNPEWTAEDFRRAVKVPKGRKLSDAPALLKRGRPKIANPKVAIKLRLDSDVLEAYRETGWLANQDQRRLAEGKAVEEGWVI